MCYLYVFCFLNCCFIYGYGSIPINTIFRGMNIHLPAILMWTKGVQGFDTLPYRCLSIQYIILFHESNQKRVTKDGLAWSCWAPEALLSHLTGGGSLGSSWIQVSWGLGAIPEMEWNVVERNVERMTGFNSDLEMYGNDAKWLKKSAKFCVWRLWMIGMVGKGLAAASAVRTASLRAGQLEFHHQYMNTKLTQIYIPNQQK